MRRACTEQDRERMVAKLAHMREITTGAAKQRDPSACAAAPPDGIPCARCGNTGWVEVPQPDGYGTVMPCPECYERRMVVRRLKKSGVSAAEYARYMLGTFDPSRSGSSAAMKTMAEQYIREHWDGGPGIGFFGSSGTGKTHLCIAVCQEITKRYHEPHFYFSYRAQIPELKKAMGAFKNEYEDLMRPWKTCRNLYIDDLFKLSGSRSQANGNVTYIEREDLQVMFDLINARYLNHKTTIFSSQYTIQGICRIDDAIGSRIWEMINPWCLNITGRNQRTLRMPK